MFLSFFTVQDCVILPGEKKYLHALNTHSDRSNQLFGDLKEGDIFGLCPCERDILGYGTESRLLTLSKKLEDGSYSVEVEGLRVFKIDEFVYPLPGKSYPGGEVSFLDGDDLLSEELQDALVEQIHGFLEIAKVDIRIPSGALNTFQHATLHQLSFQEKLGLIKLASETERAIYLVDLLEKKLNMYKQVIKKFRIDLTVAADRAKRINPSDN
ncbi:hypothetical protein GCM10009119_37150 [Algoriphagus jejuensis]|uniref:Lon N-terminal domain-containing protein n=1 Tax=Algoriphagus jejuensis TaxID=419934 RepID=A0ABN1N549_9BACT